MQSRVRKLVSTALFSVFALALTYIESLIPINVVIPGFKLGLSNIVVAFVITIDPVAAFTILVLKISISALLFGTPISFVFSLCGGVLAFTFMLLIIKVFRTKISFLGIGTTGAFFHNLGQLFATALLYGFTVALSYSTPMLISGIVFGGVLGLMLNLFSERIIGLIEKMY